MVFEKILVANRGEIACRIARTARRMGIRTVAVYSDADRNALHVRMMDEAVHLGPAQPAESYLAIEKIVGACKSTGAGAVHPGYGFLSERAAFAEALGAAGIVFIGPNPAAIEAMGDKIASKKFADAAKVATVPGQLDVILDHAEMAGNGRDFRPRSGFLRLDFIAHRGNRLGIRADKNDAGLGECGRESRPLGQKAIAGMHGLSAALPTSGDDLCNVEIALRRRRRPDCDRRIGHLDMQRIAVRIGIDRNCRYTHAPRGLDNAAGDLAAIGNQDPLEHATMNPASLPRRRNFNLDLAPN